VTRRAAGTAGGIAAAVPAALFVALAGTALHRHDLVLDGVGGLGGLDFPWGAVAALVLLGSVQLWLGAAFRSVIPTAVCGVLCYALTGWWSTLETGKRVVIGDTAGNIWVFGIAGITVAMLVWCRRYRRPPG
jgi:N-acetyl-1-D-myo-inositol-2-amino-2-deoxy-alpha-D-glucopyranoside deacetylase